MTGAVLAGKLVSPRQLLGVCLQSEGRYEPVTLTMNSAKMVTTEWGASNQPHSPFTGPGSLPWIEGPDDSTGGQQVHTVP